MTHALFDWVVSLPCYEYESSLRLALPLTFRRLPYVLYSYFQCSNRPPQALQSLLHFGLMRQLCREREYGSLFPPLKTQNKTTRRSLRARDSCSARRGHHPAAESCKKWTLPEHQLRLYVLVCVSVQTVTTVEDPYLVACDRKKRVFSTSSPGVRRWTIALQ